MQLEADSFAAMSVRLFINVPLRMARRLAYQLLAIQHLFLVKILIPNLPFHTLRKHFYRRCGMKLSSSSTIFRHVEVDAPEHIQLGHGSIVGWHCYLDGRGGLRIGNNVIGVCT